MNKSNLFVSFFVVIAIVFLTILAGGQIQNLNVQNKKLESKIDKLTQEISKLSSSPNQIISNNIVEEEKTAAPTTTKKVLGTSVSKEDVTPTSTPNPTPQVSPTPFVKVGKVISIQNNNVSAPVSTPTPAPAPTPIISKASVNIENQGNYEVNLIENDTAFSVLLRAGDENNFNIDYTNYEGMGAFVNCIGGVCAHDNYFWAFYYNNVSSMVGASLQSVGNGDIIGWKFESW